MNDSPDSSNLPADSPQCPDSGPATPATPARPEPVEAEIVPDPGPVAPPPAPDYDDHGVPSLDYVRDKIETRYATSLGAAELAQESEEARSIEEQEAERERAGKAKLDEIRRSMGR
ncbi:hypothetical protein HF577_20785 [Pseudonocardia xinjiangensis]|uniref:PspA domain-containing protein n=1 Tax=Pseudonocardia xinjiangensis TaxID=75289 RepID=A0ABX1RGI9_9PSEU|nr:hypothetical protein [Pseudonocardia xinjiangensis]